MHRDAIRLAVEEVLTIFVTDTSGPQTLTEGRALGEVLRSETAALDSSLVTGPHRRCFCKGLKSRVQLRTSFSGGARQRPSSECLRMKIRDVADRSERFAAAATGAGERSQD